MTEKEKMLSGEMYDSSDKELKEERQRARRLCYKYNIDLHPDDKEKKNEVLKELLGNVGEGAHIEPPFVCDYGSYIEAGKNLYINFGCTILDCAKVKFGDNVMLAPNVGIYTAGHPLNSKRRHIDLIEFASTEELKIAFNYKYVLESLKTMETSEVKIGLNSALSATVLKPNNEEDFVCLIMPVQIRG